jgi:ubiquinone/menaquinone biosynthesis C-methylase UbiE
MHAKQVEAARLTEIARYDAAYRNPAYRMGDRRRRHVEHHLRRIPKGSLLDVSTGRGEVLVLAADLGHGPVMGTEAVRALCDGTTVVDALAHALPFADDSFDTVTMFDVMEHLVPEDTALVCEELRRVAKNRILLTVCNQPSSFGSDGDLHINRRLSYETWHRELRDNFAPWSVIRHGAQGSISEMFEVVRPDAALA